MAQAVKVMFMRKNKVFMEAKWYIYQSVQGMKAEISAKTNIPVNNQIFAFNGCLLPNIYTRGLSGINEDGCRIQLFLTNDTEAITAVLGDQRIVVPVNVLWTIKAVKAQMIPSIARVFPEDPDFHQDLPDPNIFDLYLRGRLVDENSTVLLLKLNENLNEGDELLVAKRYRVELTINQSSQDWLFLNRLTTIGQLKQHLNTHFEVPMNATLHLVGHGDLNNDAHFLNHIQNGSRLIATFHPPVLHDFTHLLR